MYNNTKIITRRLHNWLYTWTISFYSCICSLVPSFVHLLVTGPTFNVYVWNANCIRQVSWSISHANYKFRTFFIGLSSFSFLYLSTVAKLNRVNFYSFTNFGVGSLYIPETYTTKKEHHCLEKCYGCFYNKNSINTFLIKKTTNLLINEHGNGNENIKTNKLIKLSD